MAGKLTINKINNCRDLTITMDNARIIGDYTSLQINDVRNSEGTNISMKNMEVMTHDQYVRSKTGSASSSYRAGSSGGQLTVNSITDSRDTTINQDEMKIYGRFDDVKMNDISKSSDTEITMRNAVVNADIDSDSDEDIADNASSSGHNSTMDSSDVMTVERDEELDEDGLPRPSTYGYYVAEKFNFNIRLGPGAHVTCTFLQKDRVRTIKSFIVELQPSFKGKSFRLQVVGSESEAPKYVDDDTELTLKEAGFKDKMELRTVFNTPEGDR